MKMDLNLFRVFDVLVELRSVSRAADRLGVTQSAVSHALARLREQLDDPLFVRSGGGLRPTARARAIAPAVRDGLSRLRDATSPAAFDPATTTRAFTLSAGTYFCTTLLPAVIARVRGEAPLAHVRVVAPGAETVPGLDDGTVDLALGGVGRFPDRLAHAPLFTERMVWVGRAGDDPRPPAERPRLAIAAPRSQAGSDDALLRGDADRTGAGPVETFPAGPSHVTIHDALSAGAILARSDLVTQLPGQLAKRFAERAALAMLGDGDLPAMALAMFWHPRSTADPAHVWLRGLFADAAGALD